MVVRHLQCKQCQVDWCLQKQNAAERQRPRHNCTQAVHQHYRTVQEAVQSSTHLQAVVLLQLQAGGVGQPDPGHHGAPDTPDGRHEEHLALVSDVGDPDAGDDGAQLAHGGSETVVRGADVSREDLAGDEPGGGVGAELVEIGGEVVEGLEGMHTGLRRALGAHVVPLAVDDDVEDKHGEEAGDLHQAAAVPFLVDQGSCGVVASEGDEVVENSPLLLLVGGGGGVQQADEQALLKLVAVESEVVGDPGGGGDHLAGPEVPGGQQVAAEGELHPVVLLLLRDLALNLADL